MFSIPPVHSSKCRRDVQVQLPLPVSQIASSVSPEVRMFRQVCTYEPLGAPFCQYCAADTAGLKRATVNAIKPRVVKKRINVSPFVFISACGKLLKPAKSPHLYLDDFSGCEVGLLHVTC